MASIRKQMRCFKRMFRERGFVFFCKPRHLCLECKDSFQYTCAREILEQSFSFNCSGRIEHFPDSFRAGGKLIEFLYKSVFWSSISFQSKATNHSVKKLWMLLLVSRFLKPTKPLYIHSASRASRNSYSQASVFLRSYPDVLSRIYPSFYRRQNSPAFVFAPTITNSPASQQHTSSPGVTLPPTQFARRNRFRLMRSHRARGIFSGYCFARSLGISCFSTGLL